jgi:hypothetical protein
VLADELLGEFDDLTAGVRGGVPPAVFIRRAEDVDDHRRALGVEAELPSCRRRG